MQRHRRSGAAQRVDDGAIFEFVEYIARLAGARKARETRAPRADTPGRDRHPEGGHRLHDGFDLETTAPQLEGERVEIRLELGAQRCIALGDEIRIERS